MGAWYLWWDSNPQPLVSKTNTSSSWATQAWWKAEDMILKRGCRGQGLRPHDFHQSGDLAGSTFHGDLDGTRTRLNA